MKKHGFLWWVFIGWWWVPITLPFRLLASKTDEKSENLDEHLGLSVVDNHLDEIMALAKQNTEYRKADVSRTSVYKKVYEHKWPILPAELVPNPEDPKDIKVLASSRHIGNIKVGSCAHVQKLLRENRIQNLKVEIGGGKYKMLIPDQDSDRESYKMEQDSQRVWVDLTISIRPEKERRP